MEWKKNTWKLGNSSFQRSLGNSSMEIEQWLSAASQHANSISLPKQQEEQAKAIEVELEESINDQLAI